MTVSGAAAATTMKTMAPGPSLPRRRWALAASVDAVSGGGFETVAKTTSRAVGAYRPGRTALAVEPGPSAAAAGYTAETKLKHPRDIERETALTLFSFGNGVRDMRGGYARLPPGRERHGAAQHGP